MLVTLSATAHANFTSAQLAQISASPSPQAALPLGLSLQDEGGQVTTIGGAIGGVPAVVIFADYTCRTLCGPIVEFTAAGLAKTGLSPGVDYRLVVIGINPHDGDDAARAMRAQHIAPGNPVGRAAVFLSGPDGRHSRRGASRRPALCLRSRARPIRSPGRRLRCRFRRPCSPRDVADRFGWRRSAISHR